MTLKSGWMNCVALCGLVSTMQVFAACEKPFLAGDFGYSVCKDWPAYPGLTIKALSQFESGYSASDYGPQGKYDLNLAVVSAGDSKPLATYHKAAAFESDAIAFEDLQLDTARYQLTPDLRAFGVRATFNGSSRVNPVNEKLLSLYVKEVDRLRPVLEKLITYEYGGEWDGNCGGELYQHTRTLEIGKTSSHGYADLIVKTVTTREVGKGEVEACESKTLTAKPVLTTLRYDGKSYILPQGFKGI
ncbi:PA3715 family protein [Pseudomonas sp. LB3P81]